MLVLIDYFGPFKSINKHFFIYKLLCNNVLLLNVITTHKGNLKDSNIRIQLKIAY